MLRERPPPLAYLITWRTYGTFLHGDARGAVDREHNTLDTPKLGRNSARVDYELRLLKSEPITLDHRARKIVERTIADHCTIRAWTLHAVSARSTHVHVVVTCPGFKPEPAMGQFKSWCTRRLREAGLVPAGSPVWAEHGSTRWLNDTAGLEGAIRYVLERQDLPSMS